MEAASVDLDVLVTLDRNIGFQQAAGSYALGVVILISRFNHLAAYRPQFAEIRDLAKRTRPGQVNTLKIA